MTDLLTQLEKVSRQAQRALARRDALILQARAQDIPLRRIARVTDLSHQTIFNIENRKKANQ